MIGSPLRAMRRVRAADKLCSLVVVTSYDMPNGDGQAQGGWLNYWDAAYSNCPAGDCTTDGTACKQ